jgi:hypothetical protein
MADGRLVALDREAISSEKLDHGYAVTVHRSQGDTTGRAHRFADGGGRELAYVSMSRAVERTTVYAVADDLDQARADLVQDWSVERRQRWAIDTGTPTTHAAELEDAREVPSQLQMGIREARLRAERDAVAAAIPPDRSAELRTAQHHLRRLNDQRDGLERRSGGYLYSPEGRPGLAVAALQLNLAHAEQRGEDRRLGRAQRHEAKREAQGLRPRLEAAVEHWHRMIGPRHSRIVSEIDELTLEIGGLEDAVQQRRDWLGRHPEAVPRLQRLEGELDALRPSPSIERPLAAGLEFPTHDLSRYLDGPELEL